MLRHIPWHPHAKACKETEANKSFCILWLVTYGGSIFSPTRSVPIVRSMPGYGRTAVNACVLPAARMRLYAIVTRSYCEYQLLSRSNFSEYRRVSCCTW